MFGAGGGAYQTLLKRVAAPGYPSRPDIAVHAVTIQVPLEASLPAPPVQLCSMQAQICTILSVFHLKRLTLALMSLLLLTPVKH